MAGWPTCKCSRCSKDLGPLAQYTSPLDSKSVVCWDCLWLIDADMWKDNEAVDDPNIGVAEPKQPPSLL